MEKIVRTTEFNKVTRTEVKVTKNLPKALKPVHIVMNDGSRIEDAYLEANEYAFTVRGGTFGRQVKVADVAEWEYAD